MKLAAALRTGSLMSSIAVAFFITGAGCQRGKSAPPDMAEWGLDDAPRRSVVREETRASGRVETENQPIAPRLSDPSPLGSLIGRTCSVQFRRDALGMAAGAPLSPTAESSGGRPARLRGTLTAVGDGWITLSADGATYHIPQATILLIETVE